MQTAPLKSAHFAVRLGARAVVVTGIYVAAAAAILLTLFLLRGVVSPIVLRGVLGFVFVAALSGGLEPGTVKAAALGPGGVDLAAPVAYLTAGALKALVASPVLAALWRFADPSADPAVLVWLPLIAVAGFCATDMRVLLDLKGRYGLAIALKQGSLAGGVVIVGALAALKAPLFWAVGVATLARLALLAPALWRGPVAALTPAVRRLLGDRRWLELAAVSVIAAASGSADRVFGLRYLSPAAYAGYYLTFELFSKFWLIPYVIGPILFARQAAGERSGRFIGGAWAFTALAGLAFLIAAAALMRLAPGPLTRLTGISFGPATLVFAAGVVVGSFTQLRMAQIQGAGASRRAAGISAVSAVFSILLFYLAARSYGAEGLLIAWLVKSLVELALTLAPLRPRRVSGT